MSRDERRTMNWSSLGLRARLAVAAFGCVCTLVGFEIASRGYWRLVKSVPATRTGEIWRAFYPEIAASRVENRNVDPDSIDVLLLGGSVLHPDFGCVAELLSTQGRSAFGRPVRVFNLANMGRTSRDSLWKYERVVRGRFDLVILYEGINDVHMNNCTSATYRDDYTHYAWYDEIAALDRHPEKTWWATPYTLHYMAINYGDKWLLRSGPSRRRQDQGTEIKTARAFESNVARILSLAASRGDRVLASTFAVYIPDDYTLEKFKERSLDYGSYACPVETWGLADNVRRTVQVHNAVVRRLAAERPAVLLVDQDGLIPKNRMHFDDPCHLTEAGCRRFVANILETLKNSPLPATAHQESRRAADRR